MRSVKYATCLWHLTYLTSEWGKPARQTISVTIKCCICPGGMTSPIRLERRYSQEPYHCSTSNKQQRSHAWADTCATVANKSPRCSQYLSLFPPETTSGPWRKAFVAFVSRLLALCVAVPGSISWQWKIPTPVNCKLLLRFNDNNKNAKKPLDFENVSVQLGFGILELFDELQWVNTEIFLNKNCWKLLKKILKKWNYQMLFFKVAK